MIQDGLTDLPNLTDADYEAHRIQQLEEALVMQGDINTKLILTIRGLESRIALLEENRQKPNALILPPRIQ